MCCSEGFKTKVVKLTERLDVKITEISEILDLHPVMVYRWRQEHREGKLLPEQTRRIGMAKNKVKIKAQKKMSELQQLKKENLRLAKENDFQKKVATVPVRTKKDRFCFIKEHRSILGVRYLCDWLN